MGRNGKGEKERINEAVVLCQTLSDWTERVILGDTNFACDFVSGRSRDVRSANENAKIKRNSLAGSRTPVSSVTSSYTDRYTTREERIGIEFF